MIEGLNLKDELSSLLGEGEQVIIERVRSLLLLGMPSKTEEVKLHVYLSKLVMAQEELTALRFAVAISYNRKWYSKESAGVKVYEDLREEGYSAQESKSRMFQDSKYIDQCISADNSKSLLDYLDNLIWQVKDTMRVLS